MSGMLQAFVKQEMDRLIKEDYPHIQYPSGVYAKITRVEQKDDIFTYSLKILDKNRSVDNDFPEIPNVKSASEFQKEEVVAVILMYGGSSIFILGRADQ